MVYGGGGRVRRYRAAVYMQCASERDVDTAFDLLTEMMLSDRREDYLWGVLMDLAPSSLFRTFGDYEIEERVRYRFDRLCAEYGECGFFAILRGRRYGGRSGFRCEGGIYGAIKVLAGGSGDGCSLRLCTVDTVKRSDRVFIWDARGSETVPFFPCDITRSSYLNGTVILSPDDGFYFGARRRLIKSIYGENPGNYRVIGWICFPLEPSERVSIYGVYTPEKRICTRGIHSRSDYRIYTLAVEHAGRDFVTMSEGDGISELATGSGTDRLSALLLAYVALGALEVVDAVNLRKTLFRIAETLPAEVEKISDGSMGFLRLALLVSSAFCDSMGGYGEEFYSVSAKLKEYAEGLRLEWDSGRIKSDAPFLPCETLVFRRIGGKKNGVFMGFTAPKRLCDRFLYLFSGDGARQARMIVELLSCGFGERGILARNGDSLILNALLIALCAERQRGIFSRILVRVPELRACRRFFYALP